MDKITAQVGQIIEVNGKQYRATESGFVLVEVKVDSQDGIMIHLEADTAYLGDGNQILLIEGVDL